LRLASLAKLARLTQSKHKLVRWLARVLVSVQFRTTLAAIAVVGSSLLLAFIGTTIILRKELTQNVIDTAKNEAYDIVLLVRDDRMPNPLPLPRGDLAAQVVSNTGQVVSYTPNLKGVPPLRNPQTIPPGGVLQMRTSRRAKDLSVNGNVDEHTIFVAYPVQIPSQLAQHLARKQSKKLASQISAGTVPTDTFYVYTIASLASVDQSVETLSKVLELLYPIMILVVGASTYILSHRAFAPVEQMRRDVDTITASNLSNRIFQPNGSDEISKLAGTMNQMLERLEHSVNLQKQFIADASHELKSPLSALRAALEIGLIHPEATNWVDVASLALSESDRMQHLIEDLLLLAKTEAGIKFKHEPVDLDELVREEVLRLRKALNRVRIDISQLGAARVEGDIEQLRSVVRNLLENAVRYATSNVVVSLGPVKWGFQLEIGDDGPGIPVERRSEVFERFARLDPSRSRSQGGSGLGLAIVQSVVKAMGGSIAVGDSSLGGASFVVFWPAEHTEQSQTELLDVTSEEKV
jgi:signal transduction histidine kinase